MKSPATPFFRDVRMPSAWNDRYARERFLLDTLAERKVEEKPTRMSRFRTFASRGAALLKIS